MQDGILCRQCAFLFPLFSVPSHPLFLFLCAPFRLTLFRCAQKPMKVASKMIKGVLNAQSSDELLDILKDFSVEKFSESVCAP